MMRPENLSPEGRDASRRPSSPTDKNLRYWGLDRESVIALLPEGQIPENFVEYCREKANGFGGMSPNELYALVERVVSNNSLIEIANKRGVTIEVIRKQSTMGMIKLRKMLDQAKND